MLVYESEGFLAVESKEISQLYRSVTPVSLDDSGDDAYAIHAVLCEHQDNSVQRCRVVFYSKALKRGLIFSVDNPEKQPSLQHAQETLTLLGFQLEEVNLKLSPAMLEVVLRDVAGLVSPAEARKLQQEKAASLEEYKKIFDKNPESVEGRKAALRLNAEKHLNDRCKDLRLLLEELLASGEAVRNEIEALSGQVKDLSARLASAETLVGAERKQREMSEAITAAAEKRIRELEEVLVDVDTRSAEALTQSRENKKLRQQLEELSGKLASVEAELANEQEKQAQHVAEAHTAQDRIEQLEKELKDVRLSLENSQGQVTEEQTEKTRLEKSLGESAVRIKTLENELAAVETRAAQCDEFERLASEIQARLDEAGQSLQDALDNNGELEKRLAAANAEGEGLRKKLQAAENAVGDKGAEEERLNLVMSQKDELARELEILRDQHVQESRLRKQLETDAQGNEKRISELESSLARATANKTPPETNQPPTVDQAGQLKELEEELSELKQRIDDEQKSRQKLEAELEEAHTMIDSLEKLIRENEQAAAEKLAFEAAKAGKDQKVSELLQQLEKVLGQLEEERIERKSLAAAVAAAEKKLVEQQQQLRQGQSRGGEGKVGETVATEPVAKVQKKSSKPLPHELRPAPKKGALFCPDWDLEGLPCRASDQVLRAWESLFNVQISLEGYPSQYCMAYLVVLKQEKQKGAYLLCHLKKNKHTLVMVPAKAPQDDASLEGVIQKGLQFLKLSGFEMEEMSAENIASSLTPYFTNS